MPAPSQSRGERTTPPIKHRHINLLFSSSFFFFFFVLLCAYFNVLRQLCLLHQLLRAKLSRDHHSLERVLVDILAQVSKSILHEGGIIEVLFINCYSRFIVDFFKIDCDVITNEYKRSPEPRGIKVF